MNKPLILDAAALSFVQGQAYTINPRVYEERFPDWDFSRLAFVDTSGPAWAPGVMTYSSTISGAAQWQSGYAKDVPLADVGQSMALKQFHLAAIGYQYNIEEINTALNIVGGSLDARRARAARMAYTKFMYDLVINGSSVKGMTGLINNAGVTAVAAAADGTGSARAWVGNDGVGLKTPAQIQRDVNSALMRVNSQTQTIEYADTLLIPPLAYQYIASTPYSAMFPTTVLEWIRLNNIYTATTGIPLTIMSLLPLATAATTSPVAGHGRLVAYKNDQNYVKTHLPMPHQFLPVYQDGPFNYMVPGIFRTGGLEIVATETMAYLDGITPVPA